MKKLLFVCLLLVLSCAQARITEIYNPKTQSTYSLEQFIQALPSSGHIVLGEFHNQPEIQKAQAQIIKKKIEHEFYQGDFAVHWEFLDYPEQKYINKVFWDYIANQITAEEFLIKTAGQQNLSYAPIMEQVKNLHGNLLAINLPRKLKQKVIQGGITSIDRKYVPDSHYVGGTRYKERFVKVMGNHVPPEKIDSYFLAQCLTDSVMADQIFKHSNSKLNFVIAGSFHTDFKDATVIRLDKLTGIKSTTLKIVSENINSAEEIESYKAYDPNYGYYADYIIITR